MKATIYTFCGDPETRFALFGAIARSWASFVFVLALGVLLPVPTHAQDWQMVWNDEFDQGTMPDASKWTFQVGGGGWGNQELQY